MTGCTTLTQKPTVTVFISSPGNVQKERDCIDQVVRELANQFRPYICLVGWRFERDAPLCITGPTEAVQDVIDRAAGAYDIYIGVMCGRFGTPTRSAPAGTVDEFQQACIRFRTTGRPDVLFYFCAAPPSPSSDVERAQLNAVRQFQSAYAGLYATYHSPVDLQNHLRLQLHRLLMSRLMKPRIDLSEPIVQRLDWAVELMRIVDDAAQQQAVYLRPASTRVRLGLERLAVLIDFREIREFDQSHRQDLVACGFLAWHLRYGGRLREAVRRLTDHGFPVERVDQVASAVTLALGENEIDLAQDGDAHTAFKAALARLMAYLTLDRTAFQPGDALSPPLPEAALDDWMCHLVHRVEPVGNGVLRLRSITPAEAPGQGATINRFLGLHFEAMWQRIRRALTSCGVVLGRVPTQTFRSPLMPALPFVIIERISQDIEKASSTISKVEHYGEDRLDPEDLVNLLPIPGAIVWEPFEFPAASVKRLLLRITPLDCDAPGAGVIEREFAGPDAPVLAPKGLTEGHRYMWALIERNADFARMVDAGSFRTAADVERINIHIVEEERREEAMLHSGLWNDWLARIWPRLQTGRACVDDALSAYRILIQGYDWYYQNHPKSARLETYRNAINHLRKLALQE